MKKQMRKADQPKIKQRKHIAFRMNFLFFSIFILFSLLILRLGYLQIVKGETYTLELERKEEIPVNTSVPRGRIYDRNGTLLVGNNPQKAITYTKTTSTTAEDMYKTAVKLADLIEKDTKRVNVADKKDFWILLHPKEAIKKVTKEEQTTILNESDLSQKEKTRKLNKLTRDRITEEEIDSFSEQELKVLAIYREMVSGYAYSPQIVKNEEVTDEEFAAVSERLNDLQGVDTTTDWERVKISQNTILGSTTSPLEGIPFADLNYFLARDYSRNDRVGKSYFESYYEELLKGQKTVVKNIKDRTGRVIETKTVREGEPGKDLVLTIDNELQEGMEELISSKLLELKTSQYAQFLDRAFLVMMNPNTGEVLSMVGKKIVKNSDTGKNEIRDYTIGTFGTSYEMGSTVKLATLLTGYEYGAAKIGETKIDEPIYLKGTKVKRTLFNKGESRIPTNDIQAIGRSSNVYMFKIAMGIGNYSYVRNSPFRIDLAAFDKMRNSYASFGLGAKTEIDLPGEVTGISEGKEAGKLLDLAIGQYDTYTPLQMVQYVSTVANGGYRIAPRVLKEIHEPSPDGEVLGSLIEENGVKVLNRINNSAKEIEQVKQGMYYTYYGPNGTAGSLFKGASYEAAGKTGTAEAGYYEGEDRNLWGTRTISVTHVGFAPFDKPEIAYAVVFPHVATANVKNTPHPNNEVARAATDLFFELKQKRATEQSEGTSSVKIKTPEALTIGE